MPQDNSNNNEIPWMEKVFALVAKIPKGKVTSYGAIAEKIGTRTTARMVGWAMNASHRLPKKIPAHRVVNRNGLLTGRHHFETPTLMQNLLEAEGIEIENHQILNFNHHLWIP